MDKKKALLTVAIALIFAFFVGYGIEVFHPGTSYQKVCPDVYGHGDQESCEKAGGLWLASAPGKDDSLAKKEISPGFCQQKPICHEEFNVISARHDRIVFIVAVVVGLLAVLAGIVLKKDAISTGILAGGVVTILYGTIRYWQHANDILKFVLLGVVLAVLLWVGYKKFDRGKA